ncbi:MAG TPA: hypothetical protein VN688_14385 [Gemmataceae bacterium]|nr:hypothetical protein [Gemmataceae bacterium]
MVDVRGILGDVAGLMLVAIRSFLLTFLLFLLLGVVLAFASYYMLSAQNGVYGVIAALIALIECVVVGIVLGAKRAVVVAMLHGLHKYQLGSAAVRLIFGRLLGVSAEQAHGERGGWATRTAERLPLAQAEQRLDDAIHHLVQAPPAGSGLTGWLRCRVQIRLTNTVGKFTLARFREEHAQHGGVDLAKVQTNLGDRIDDLLIGKLRGGINLWTAIAVVGLPSQILVTDYIVLGLLK